MIRVLLAIMVMAIAYLPAAPLAADAPPLRIGLLPTETALQVIRRAEPFRAAMAQALGREVEIVVGTDYVGTMEGLRFGKVDLAFLGPASYTLLRNRAAVEPLARPVRGGKSSFTSVIIARTNGPASLADLAGKRVGFGDVASTAGHFVPRHMLHAKGLTMRRDYAGHYLGGHDAVALAVQAGRVDAGGLSQAVFETLVERGTIDGSRLAVIAQSEPIPEYVFVLAPGVPAQTRDAVRAAILGLTDRDALRAFNADGFIPALAEDYAIVGQWMREIGVDGL